MLIDILGVNSIIARLVLGEGVLETNCQVVHLSFLEEKHLKLKLLDVVRISISFSLYI